ncbi:MAG: hypothetical protein WC412_06570 [Candidatus Omnitrophota bacterium]|jgi:hypothetical protein
MKKLLVLVFVAAMCVSSYGDILVYKVAINFNPYQVFTNDSYSAATVSVALATGYEVLDVDMDTGEANASPTLIFYNGKGYKWCYDIDASEDSYFYGFDIKGTTGRGINGYTIIDGDAGSWICYLYGKSAMTDIGRFDRRKVYIPKSLKGVSIILYGGSAPTEAYGNIIMTLDAKYTKVANVSEADQYEMVDRILADLEAKGYNYQE